ncbi:MAG: hypothetical protein IIA12_01445, partial [Proteobacteria bacterium]|nr:hypothetical protein [Pseudomonadota bacterium]
CCTPALADFEMVTLVKAMETSPANIILPASVNGMVSFRPCAEKCDEKYERARLTADTTFTVEGKTVKYEELRKVHAEIRNAADSYALISVDVARITVTSIDLAR